LKKKILIIFAAIFVIGIFSLFLSQSFIASYFLYKGFKKSGTPISSSNLNANIFSGNIVIDDFLEIENNATVINSIKIESLPLSFLSDTIQLLQVSINGGVVKSNSFLFRPKKKPPSVKINIHNLKISDLIVFLPSRKSEEDPLKIKVEELNYVLNNSHRFDYDHLQRISFKGQIQNTSIKINYPKITSNDINEISLKNVSIKKYSHLLPVVYGLITNREIDGKVILSLKSDTVVNVRTIIDLRNIELIDLKNVNIFKKIPYKLLSSYLNNNIEKEMVINFSLPRALFSKHPNKIRKQFLRILPKLILLQVF